MSAHCPQHRSCHGAPFRTIRAAIRNGNFLQTRSYNLLFTYTILYFIHQQTLLCLFRPAGFRNFILINPLTNYRMKVTKERLSYLKQAQYVQRLAEPYIRKGKLPLWKIHTKFVIEEAPVSLNTFRKMLKEDVSHLMRRSKSIVNRWRSSTTGRWRRNGANVSEANNRPAAPPHRPAPVRAVPAAVPSVLRHGNSFPRSRKRRRTGTCKRVGRPANGIPPPETFPAGVMQGSDSSERPPHVARRTGLRRNGRYLYLIHGAFLSSQFLTSTARSLLSASAPR